MGDFISPLSRLPGHGELVLATDGIAVVPCFFSSNLCKYTWANNRYVTEEGSTMLEGNWYFREGTVTGWKPLPNTSPNCEKSDG